jgi:hypothetical protein
MVPLKILFSLQTMKNKKKEANIVMDMDFPKALAKAAGKKNDILAHEIYPAVPFSLVMEAEKVPLWLTRLPYSYVPHP